MFDGLKENVEDVLGRVAKAAKAAGTSVKIIAATKTVDAARINAISPLGIEAMGENRVQELLTKYGDLKMGEIHFIGALQTNKVKYIIDKVSMIQSVDRTELALEIDKRAAAINKIMPVLIEVNVGGEESKSGCAAGGLFPLIDRLLQMKNLKMQGLMSVLPIGASTELYDKMSLLRQQANARYGGFEILSMGMSDDFERAIAHGSNMVRIGSGIFGKRKYDSEK